MKNRIVIFNRHAELPAEQIQALCQCFIVLACNCPQTDCSLHRTLFPANGMLQGLCSRQSPGGAVDPDAVERLIRSNIQGVKISNKSIQIMGHAKTRNTQVPTKSKNSSFA
jgi:hypothetical protein